jgi:hypothetical protein
MPTSSHPAIPPTSSASPGGIPVRTRRSTAPATAPASDRANGTDVSHMPQDYRAGRAASTPWDGARTTGAPVRRAPATTATVAPTSATAMVAPTSASRRVTQFTGYRPARMRGEMASFQVLGAR